MRMRPTPLYAILMMPIPIYSTPSSDVSNNAYVEEELNEICIDFDVVIVMGP